MTLIMKHCRCGFARHYTWLSFLRCMGINVGWRDTDLIEWSAEREGE